MTNRVLATALSSVLTIGVLVGITNDAVAAKKKNSKPVIKVQNSKFDADAREVELFQGMDQGELDTKVLAKDPFNATVLIENKTDKPLNVKFPKAVITAPVLAQMGGMGGGMGGMGGGGGGGGMGGGGGQMGGGGMGGGGGGMGGMGGGGGGMGGMGGGGGMFSVPPEKIVSVPLNTVCLQHGKQDPNLSMKYKLLPVEEFSQDGMMVEFLTMVGSGRLNRNAAQAAAWHLSNKMSWQELATKEEEHLGGFAPTPYFAQEELQGAQEIVAMTRVRTLEKADQSTDAKTTTEEQQPAEPKVPANPRPVKPVKLRK